MKQKWYLQTWFICLLFALWMFVIPGIVGIILLIMQMIDNSKLKKASIIDIENLKKENSDLECSLQELSNENTKLKKESETLNSKLEELGASTFFEVNEQINALSKKYSDMENDFNIESQQNNTTISRLRDEIASLEGQYAKLSKQTLTQERKLRRSRELYNSIDYCITNFLENDIAGRLCHSNATDYDEFAPSIILKLHCMDIKDLRKAYKENDKAINQILTAYASRYTTKANRSIYQLMVIALRAELQNVLYNLKYEKLEQSIENIKDITSKYLKIVGEGNQSIAGTLTKFIGEIEYLFINAVKIEYNYYVKKEQAKQEQLALKQQMREEAEERKQLEQQRKKIEQEESKYQAEIEKANEILSTTTDDKQIADLKNKILQLQSQLSDVTIKKDEITKLQNGKAGNVYIISNLGSFGENVFKIGMTRRINPQERIDELGSASVPFRFDVHSFIFSDDAVGLENRLHSTLNDKRVNKVNMRKEFFYASLDELESLVTELDPTAEFNKTMLAEEFRQSQSTDAPYTSDYSSDFDEDEE